MRKKTNWLMACLILLTGCKTLVTGLQVDKIILLSDFPSGSSLEYYKNMLYLIGDDATKLLILDTGYNRRDSILLFKESKLTRITKALKADLEASAIISVKNQAHLLLIGSASLPTREKLILIPLNDTANLQVQSTSVYFKRLLNAGISEINIEGTTAAGKLLIMSNRGNLSHPHNHLIFTDTNFWLNQQAAAINNAVLIMPHIKNFTGISSLAYIEKNDLLLFAASTELTGNSIEDGEIGNSYIGWIKNISSKTSKRKIRADGFINLASANNVFNKEKIESICISHSQANMHIIHLVSDNDNGVTRLFKLKMAIK
jgi:hypothetical protein